MDGALSRYMGSQKEASFRIYQIPEPVGYTVNPDECLIHHPSVTDISLVSVQVAGCLIAILNHPPVGSGLLLSATPSSGGLSLSLEMLEKRPLEAHI